MLCCSACWVEHFPRKLPEGTEQFTLLLVGGANGLCDTIRLREVPLGGAEKVKQQKWFWIEAVCTYVCKLHIGT